MLQNFFTPNQWIVPVWILLTPIGSISILMSLLVVVFGFHPVKIAVRRLLYLAIFLFSAHLLFNICDFIIFSRYGIILSPFNEIYALIYTPHDLYKPLAHVSMDDIHDAYTTNYLHRHCGPHGVFLDVVNSSPKKFEYGNPDRIDLTFEIRCFDKDENILLASKKVVETEIYLTPGTNSLKLAEYEFENIKKLAHDCLFEVSVTGDVGLFLKRYPKSFFEVRNSFHL